MTNQIMVCSFGHILELRDMGNISDPLLIDDLQVVVVKGSVLLEDLPVSVEG